MHEYRSQSNNALDRLNLGYLCHIPGLHGNPDGPGYMYKNPTTALQKSWTALDFQSPRNTEGKYNLGKLLQPYFFKGKHSSQKAAFAAGSQHALQRPLCCLKDFPQFSGQCSGQPKLGSEWALLLGGERCWDISCGHACPCMHCSWSWGAWQSFQQHQKLARSHFFHLKKDVFLPYWTIKELSDIYFDGEKKKIYSLITRTRKHKSRLALRHLTHKLYSGKWSLKMPW